MRPNGQCGEAVPGDEMALTMSRNASGSMISGSPSPPRNAPRAGAEMAGSYIERVSCGATSFIRAYSAKNALFTEAVAARAHKSPRLRSAGTGGIMAGVSRGGDTGCAYMPSMRCR